MQSWSAQCFLMQNSTNVDFNINTIMPDSQKFFFFFLAERLLQKPGHCKRKDKAQCSNKHVKTIMGRRHHINRMLCSKRKITGPESKVSASNMESRFGFKEYMIGMKYFLIFLQSPPCYVENFLCKENMYQIIKISFLHFPQI